jgi:hypothetical protein
MADVDGTVVRAGRLGWGGVGCLSARACVRMFVWLLWGSLPHARARLFVQRACTSVCATRVHVCLCGCVLLPVLFAQNVRITTLSWHLCCVVAVFSTTPLEPQFIVCVSLQPPPSSHTYGRTCSNHVRLFLMPSSHLHLFRSTSRRSCWRWWAKQNTNKTWNSCCRSWTRWCINEHGGGGESRGGGGG